MSETIAWYDRIAHAWSAFNNRDPGIIDWSNQQALVPSGGFGGGSGHRSKLSYRIDKTIISSIYNRMSVDVALSKFEHVRTDEDDRYLNTMDSNLDRVLNFEANLDQSGRAFIQDLVMSMLGEGVVAGVPIVTDVDPNHGNSFDVLDMRVGRIDTWYTDAVKIEVYNEKSGLREYITLSKQAVAIIENPFYSVMNEPNSTLKRLSRRLSLMDVAAEKTTSGKLDLIIQLPFSIKNPMRKEQADKRVSSIADQLEKNEYGIAYADATEKVTQLNRPVENNSMSQIEYLTGTLYAQLGITEEVMNGTASEEVMQNYYKRTIDPIINAIIDEFERKFLSKTARTQHQAVRAYRDPFSLTTPTVMAEITDKFTRNEVLSSNEVRNVIGYKPSQDPKADELRNSNLNHPDGEGMSPEQGAIENLAMVLVNKLQNERKIE